ncbi:MAG: SDR family NAD(P)-dependent oxidoreductase, partial [Pseudomonadota bacterium]
MIDLSGTTAIVTGASRGIGEAAARRLAALGAAVVLAARGAERIEAIAAEIVAAGGRAFAARCDVARAEDVRALVARALAETGRLDIMVNNAGLIDPITRLEDSDPESWARVIDVNLKGVYHGMRFAVPAMKAQGGGTIVTISSGAAVNALEGWSHYCASKAGALALTRVADKEHRADGLRVMGLSPGTVATEMQTRIKASGINAVSRLDPSAHIPAEWAAEAIAWLCTPAADAHLGTDFSIKTDAGRAAV